MKNFIKIVIVSLTAVFMASSMVIGASAASIDLAAYTGNNVSANVYSATGSTNYTGCLTGIDVNSLLAAQNVLGNLTPTNNTSNCYTAGATSKCTKPNCKCTATNSNGSTCDTANCSGNKSATSNCAVKTANTSASFVGTGRPCGILSGRETITPQTNSKLINRLNIALAKCGLDLKKFRIPKSGDICPTATPTPNTGTAPTATPTPNAGTTPEATPTPTAETAPTATPTPNVGTSPTPAPTKTPNTGTENNGSVDNQTFEQQVAALVNEQRAANGLAPLTLSTQLSNVARTKSQDMHDNNYFSHTSPTYGSPFDMLKAFGISYRTAGENIAMGQATPQAVMTGWMNSAGHRANILNPSFTQIGVGYVANGNYWTQMFIG